MIERWLNVSIDLKYLKYLVLCRLDMIDLFPGVNTSRQIMTKRHKNYARVEQYVEKSQFMEENEYHMCDCVTIVGSGSASDILFDINIAEILKNAFQHFCRSLCCLPPQTFAMSPSQACWSQCMRLSMECRMVSQILVSRLFEGRFLMKCHGDRYSDAGTICWEFSTLLEDT